MSVGHALGALGHEQNSTPVMQITQYVVVIRFDGQKVTAICRFSVFQGRLHTFAISCGLISVFTYILFSLKVPAGINSAESQNYG